jgi:hypothetical protein
MQQLAVELLNVEEDMTGLCFPLRDGIQVFLLLSIRDFDCVQAEFPCEAHKWGLKAELNVLGHLPGSSCLGRNDVDVVHAIRVLGIFGGARGALGEVEDGKRTVFVILFWLVIVKGRALVPLSTTINMEASVVVYGFGPCPALLVVPFKVFPEDVEKQMVVNPFGQWANALATYDVSACISESTI